MKTYTLHITLYDLVFFGLFYLCGGVAVLLWFGKKQPGRAERFLALALLTFIVFVARVLVIDIWQKQLPLQILLACGPCLYFYVRTLAYPDAKPVMKDLLHLVPFLIGTGIQLLTDQADKFLQGVTLVSLLMYLYLSHKKIRLYYRSLCFTSGDRYRDEMKWLQQCMRALAVVATLFLLFTLIDTLIHLPEQSSGIHYPFYIAFGIILLWIACQALLRTYQVTIPSRPLLKARMPGELRNKGIWLKRTLKQNHYYREPDLSLPALAEKLEMHPNELSRIINTVLNKSFNDLINEHRIADVCSRMQDPAYDHLTLLGIAFESGFNAKTTFNRAFKQITGKSPASYKNDLKKEGPNYNLERPAVFSALHSFEKKRTVMLKNYVKIAWRNLMRHRNYTTINIAGLGIGIAACLLIFLVIKYETSFDNYHRNKDSIYRVVRISRGPDGVHTGVGTPLPLADALRTDFPQIRQVSNIMQNGGSHYTVRDARKSGELKKFKEDLAYFADPQFFQIFDFKWLAGDPKTALAEPNTVVLSRKEAEKFFGDWRISMGKTISYENRTGMQVTGVFEDTPVNTDIPIKLAVSWATIVAKDGILYDSTQDWVSTFGAKNCYILLPKDLSEKRLITELAAFAKRHTPAPHNKGIGYGLQPLKDIHYNTETSVYSGHPFSKQLISVISLIGLFLLIIACVNFINLATAQAVNRSKEVGVRKVLGSTRRQLVLQFISETLIITLFAVVLAIVIALLALSMLNNLLEISLKTSVFLDSFVILFLAAVVTGVTLLAGIYPALVLSGFNPITALRNKVVASRASGISLRRVLVVAQFCIAQFLVISTLIMIYQMDYFKNKSLGFNHEAVVTVPFPADSVARLKVNALKNELSLQAGIKEISLSTFSPSDDGNWYSDFKFDHAPNTTDFASCLKWADPEYFKLYNMEFLAGGPYPKTDSVAGYVINETLLHKLGMSDPKQAIGKPIMLWDQTNLYAPITGVVKDYNVNSLRNAIPPVLMGAWQGQYSKLNIKIAPGNIRQTLAGIEALWSKTYPEGVYEYKFLDQTIADFYKKEEALSKLYKIFAGIAIYISCLGLYGLVSFMAVQRTKEVGIRKTLGASVGHIVYLFSREFTMLILVAFLLSAPLGYYLMNQWLQDYTYRISIGPGIFIWAITISMSIAWASVGMKAVKAALANPVKSLRSE